MPGLSLHSLRGVSRPARSRACSNSVTSSEDIEVRSVAAASATDCLASGSASRQRAENWSRDAMSPGDGVGTPSTLSRTDTSFHGFGRCSSLGSQVRGQHLGSVCSSRLRLASRRFSHRLVADVRERAHPADPGWAAPSGPPYGPARPAPPWSGWFPTWAAAVCGTVPTAVHAAMLGCRARNRCQEGRRRRGPASVVIRLTTASRVLSLSH